jgi:BASS family bile acid:Na+ symporter
VSSNSHVALWWPLVCQVLLLPAVCFGLAIGFGLIPEVAVGLMLLAASLGGSIANIFSHLSNGDVALNSR